MRLRLDDRLVADTIHRYRCAGERRHGPSSAILWTPARMEANPCKPFARLNPGQRSAGASGLTPPRGGIPWQPRRPPVRRGGRVELLIARSRRLFPCHGIARWKSHPREKDRELHAQALGAEVLLILSDRRRVIVERAPQLPRPTRGPSRSRELARPIGGAVILRRIALTAMPRLTTCAQDQPTPTVFCGD